MVFQWFCYPLTITIECFFADWPLTPMVFQWFFPNSGTMVNDGLGHEKTQKRVNIKYFTTNLQNGLQAPFHPFHFSSIVLICTQHPEFMTCMYMEKLPSWALVRIKTPFCISNPTSMADKVPIFILTETSDIWTSKILSNCPLPSLSLGWPFF